MPNKRGSYCASFKLQVVEYVLKGHSKNKAAHQFGIHRRRVQEWCIAEKKLDYHDNVLTGQEEIVLSEDDVDVNSSESEGDDNYFSPDSPCH